VADTTSDVLKHTSSFIFQGTMKIQVIEVS